VSVTLANLRTRARDLADEPSTGGFAVDARLTEYANYALAELHEILVNCHEEYFVKQETITLVSGTESYSVASDYFKTRKVYAKSGNTRWRLRKFTLDELDRLQDESSPINATMQNLRYAVFDSKMWFTPIPTGGSIEHWYIYKFDELSSDPDTISANLQPAWEEFVVCSMAWRLLTRGENENAPEMYQMMERAKARIISAAEERDVGEPYRVSDVSGRLGLGRGNY